MINHLGGDVQGDLDLGLVVFVGLCVYLLLARVCVYFDKPKQNRRVK